MFMAELAISSHFDPLGIVFLILDGAVVPLFAVSACHRDLDSHDLVPPSWFCYSIRSAISTRQKKSLSAEHY
jgi:hypothetical protein